MPVDPPAHVRSQISPPPQGPWTWRQSWCDLAFLHYPVDAESLRARLPAGLALQTFDGSAWVGLVSFRMCDIERRGLGIDSLLGTFPELNLRTYVSAGGKPSVWFFSLDADSWPLVIGGRLLYNLPYYKARMQHRPGHDGVDFTSQRRRRSARFAARYRPIGSTFTARPGTFEYWAAERYCLYSQHRHRGLLGLEVEHAPWPLQPAEAVITQNTIL